MRGLMKLEGARLRSLDLEEAEMTVVLNLDLGGLHYAETSFALGYMKEKVDLHRKFADRLSRGASMSEPPKLTPLTRRVVEAARRPSRGWT